MLPAVPGRALTFQDPQFALRAAPGTLRRCADKYVPQERRGSVFGELVSIPRDLLIAVCPLHRVPRLARQTCSMVVSFAALPTERPLPRSVGLGCSGPAQFNTERAIHHTCGRRVAPGVDNGRTGTTDWCGCCSGRASSRQHPRDGWPGPDDGRGRRDHDERERVGGESGECGDV